LKKTFISKLRCNRCNNSEISFSGEIITDDIREGLITCNKCGLEILVKDGIAEFLHGLPQKVLAEVVSSEGVATYCYPKEPDVYNDEWLLSLPYVKDKKTGNYDGWQRKITTFEQVLADLPQGSGA